MKFSHIDGLGQKDALMKFHRLAFGIIVFLFQLLLLSLVSFSFKLEFEAWRMKFFF